MSIHIHISIHHPSNRLSVHLSIYLPPYLRISLSVHLSICPSISLSLYLPICPSSYLPPYLSFYLSIHPHICLYVYVCPYRFMYMLRSCVHIDIEAVSQLQGEAACGLGAGAEDRLLPCLSLCTLGHARKLLLGSLLEPQAEQKRVQD